MWIEIALAVMAAWCLLSVPLALVVGRFISGPGKSLDQSAATKPRFASHAL